MNNGAPASCRQKKGLFLKAFVILMMIFMATPLVEAQPGGPGGFPGGRPPSGERPKGRTPMPGQDWNNQSDNKKASEVKKKKKVKEGDTFKVVGSLRDSVSATPPTVPL